MKDRLERANRIFQERNHGFRVLYDTIIEVTQLKPGGDMYRIIAENFVKMTSAIDVCIFTVQPRSRKGGVKLYRQDGQYMLADDKMCDRVPLDQHFLIYLREILSRESMQLDTNILSMVELPTSHPMIKESPENIYYFPLSVTGNDVDVIAISVPDELKTKDLIDTFISMSSIIINKMKNDVELLEGKERFTALFENSPIGIMLINCNREIVNVNKKLASMLDRPKSEFVGKRCFQNFCVRENKLCEKLSDRQLFNENENVILTAKGKKIPVLQSVRMIKFGNERYILETIVDLSEVKKMEEEKEILTKRLYQSQKLESLKTLAAGVAHEVNTPIQSLLNNTEFLKQAFNTYEQLNKTFAGINRKYIPKERLEDYEKEVKEVMEKNKIDMYKDMTFEVFDEMTDSITSVKQVVGYIKDFTSMEQQSKEAVDINDLVTGLVNIYRHEFKNGIILETNLHNDLPIIQGVSNRIKEVLIEMVNNASDSISSSIKSQRGKIAISTYREPDHVCLSISDNGSGIPDEIQNQVFDLFFTTKEVGKGTGQGLSYAYNIVVNEHHGDVSFTSDEDSGTTFCIKLPIEEEVI